jgi:hypothetical protein
MKIRSVRVELFHADGHTDVTKLVVPFFDFANAPKNILFEPSQMRAAMLIAYLLRLSKYLCFSHIQDLMTLMICDFQKCTLT